MSSMDKISSLFTAALSLTVIGAAAATAAAPTSATAQTQNHEQALRSNAPTSVGQAISRWQYLSAPGRKNEKFADYAGFVMAYPGYPKEELLRVRAENALDRESISSGQLLAFFDKNPPITNRARARYALALASEGREEAQAVALAAWRGGTMSSPSEAYISGLAGSQFTQDDHDQRMDALLWQRDSEGAARQIARVSAGKRGLYSARLALVQNTNPGQAGLSLPSHARSDPGYVYNQIRYYRAKGQNGSAINLLTSRPRFAEQPLDPEDLLIEMLRFARKGNANQAVQIASKAHDLFAPGEDVSTKSYRIRDDYTSLMWLGGTKALWTQGNARAAAPLFFRYGGAAQTPQTRSKGFYWAGLAARRAGDSEGAKRYFTMAAAYPDRFYGMLALNRLGQQSPSLTPKIEAKPTSAQQAAFDTAPITQAVHHVARGAPWRTGIQFYRSIAQQADAPAEHVMVADLARKVNRRDLSVNVAEAAGADGLDQFVAQGFPTMNAPQGTNWTMLHSISRQESQFAQNAISHAGARGLMQLMPGTAREQAGKMGLSYNQSRLISDPRYNVTLGDGYFARMLSYYNGSYPLAVAAYNAGPGNVNKWIRANGDPRRGGIDWVTWIERIPIYETKNYVQRVLENAVVYEALNPDKARFGTPRKLPNYLR